MIRQRPPSRSGGGPFPGGTALRKRVAPVLSLIVAMSLCALAASALFVPGFVFGADAPDRPTPATPSAGELLATLPWGGGQGEVGLENPGEGLVRGPEALAVAPNGRIVVLDSVNNRVVFLDSGGSFTGTAPVPLTEPRFLAVNDDALYVLDCDTDRLLVALGWDGAILRTIVLPELTDVVTGLFATSRGPCVEVAHDEVFLLGTSDLQSTASSDGWTLVRASLRPLEGRPVTPDMEQAANVTFKPEEGLRIRSFDVDAETLTPVQTADCRPTVASGAALEHLVSVDSDGAGGLVIGARLLETAPHVAGQASLALTRLGFVGGGLPVGSDSPKGMVVLGIMLLAESSYAYLGQPYVIAPDGRVFQPVADAGGYSILVHAFERVREVRP